MQIQHAIRCGLTFARCSKEMSSGFSIRIGLICRTTLRDSLVAARAQTAYMNRIGTIPSPTRKRRWRVAVLLAFTAGFTGLVLWLGQVAFRNPHASLVRQT